MPDQNRRFELQVAVTDIATRGLEQNTSQVLSKLNPQQMEQLLKMVATMYPEYLQAMDKPNVLAPGQSMWTPGTQTPNQTTQSRTPTPREEALAAVARRIQTSVGGVGGAGRAEWLPQGMNAALAANAAEDLIKTAQRRQQQLSALPNQGVSLPTGALPYLLAGPYNDASRQAYLAAQQQQGTTRPPERRNLDVQPDALAARELKPQIPGETPEKRLERLAADQIKSLREQQSPTAQALVEIDQLLRRGKPLGADLTYGLRTQIDAAQQAQRNGNETAYENAWRPFTSTQADPMADLRAVRNRIGHIPSMGELDAYYEAQRRAMPVDQQGRLSAQDQRRLEEMTRAKLQLQSVLNGIRTETVAPREPAPMPRGGYPVQAPSASGRSSANRPYVDETQFRANLSPADYDRYMAAMAREQQQRAAQRQAEVAEATRKLAKQEQDSYNVNPPLEEINKLIRLTERVKDRFGRTVERPAGPGTYTQLQQRVRDFERDFPLAQEAGANYVGTEGGASALRAMRELQQQLQSANSQSQRAELERLAQRIQDMSAQNAGLSRMQRRAAARARLEDLYRAQRRVDTTLYGSDDGRQLGAWELSRELASEVKSIRNSPFFQLREDYSGKPRDPEAEERRLLSEVQRAAIARSQRALMAPIVENDTRTRFARFSPTARAWVSPGRPSERLFMPSDAQSMANYLSVAQQGALNDMRLNVSEGMEPMRAIASADPRLRNFILDPQNASIVQQINSLFAAGKKPEEIEAAVLGPDYSTQLSSVRSAVTPQAQSLLPQGNPQTKAYNDALEGMVGELAKLSPPGAVSAIANTLSQLSKHIQDYAGEGGQTHTHGKNAATDSADYNETLSAAALSGSGLGETIVNDRRETREAGPEWDEARQYALGQTPTDLRILSSVYDAALRHWANPNYDTTFYGGTLPDPNVGGGRYRDKPGKFSYSNMDDIVKQAYADKDLQAEFARGNAGVWLGGESNPFAEKEFVGGEDIDVRQPYTTREGLADLEQMVLAAGLNPEQAGHLGPLVAKIRESLFTRNPYPASVLNRLRLPDGSLPAPLRHMENQQYRYTLPNERPGWMGALGATMFPQLDQWYQSQQAGVNARTDVSEAERSRMLHDLAEQHLSQIERQLNGANVADVVAAVRRKLVGLTEDGGATRGAYTLLDEATRAFVDASAGKGERSILDDTFDLNTGKGFPVYNAPAVGTRTYSDVMGEIDPAMRQTLREYIRPRVDPRFPKIAGPAPRPGQPTVITDAMIEDAKNRGDARTAAILEALAHDKHLTGWSGMDSVEDQYTRSDGFHLTERRTSAWERNWPRLLRNIFINRERSEGVGMSTHQWRRGQAIDFAFQTYRQSLTQPGSDTRGGGISITRTRENGQEVTGQNSLFGWMSVLRQEAQNFSGLAPDARAVRLAEWQGLRRNLRDPYFTPQGITQTLPAFQEALFATASALGYPAVRVDPDAPAPIRQRQMAQRELSAAWMRNFTLPFTNNIKRGTNAFDLQMRRTEGLRALSNMWTRTGTIDAAALRGVSSEADFKRLAGMGITNRGIAEQGILHAIGYEPNEIASLMAGTNEAWRRDTLAGVLRQKSGQFRGLSVDDMLAGTRDIRPLFSDANPVAHWGQMENWWDAARVLYPKPGAQVNVRLWDRTGKPQVVPVTMQQLAGEKENLWMLPSAPIKFRNNPWGAYPEAGQGALRQALIDQQNRWKANHNTPTPYWWTKENIGVYFRGESADPNVQRLLERTGGVLRIQDIVGGLTGDLTDAVNQGSGKQQQQRRQDNAAKLHESGLAAALDPVARLYHQLKLWQLGRGDSKERNTYINNLMLDVARYGGATTRRARARHAAATGQLNKLVGRDWASKLPAKSEEDVLFQDYFWSIARGRKSQQARLEEVFASRGILEGMRQRYREHIGTAGRGGPLVSVRAAIATRAGSGGLLETLSPQQLGVAARFGVGSNLITAAMGSGKTRTAAEAILAAVRDGRMSFDSTYALFKTHSTRNTFAGELAKLVGKPGVDSDALKAFINPAGTHVRTLESFVYRLVNGVKGAGGESLALSAWRPGQRFLLGMQGRPRTASAIVSPTEELKGVRDYAPLDFLNPFGNFSASAERLYAQGLAQHYNIDVNSLAPGFAKQEGHNIWPMERVYDDVAEILDLQQKDPATYAMYAGEGQAVLANRAAGLPEGGILGLGEKVALYEAMKRQGAPIGPGSEDSASLMDFADLSQALTAGLNDPTAGPRFAPLLPQDFIGDEFQDYGQPLIDLLGAMRHRSMDWAGDGGSISRAMRFQIFGDPTQSIMPGSVDPEKLIPMLAGEIGINPARASEGGDVEELNRNFRAATQAGLIVSSAFAHLSAIPESIRPSWSIGPHNRELPFVAEDNGSLVGLPGIYKAGNQFQLYDQFLHEGLAKLGISEEQLWAAKSQGLIPTQEKFADWYHQVTGRNAGDIAQTLTYLFPTNLDADVFAKYATESMSAGGHEWPKYLLSTESLNAGNAVSVGALSYQDTKGRTIDYPFIQATKFGTWESQPDSEKVIARLLSTAAGRAAMQANFGYFESGLKNEQALSYLSSDPALHGSMLGDRFQTPNNPGGAALQPVRLPKELYEAMALAIRSPHGLVAQGMAAPNDRSKEWLSEWLSNPATTGAQSIANLIDVGMGERHDVNGRDSLAMLIDEGAGVHKNAVQRLLDRVAGNNTTQISRPPTENAIVSSPAGPLVVPGGRVFVPVSPEEVAIARQRTMDMDAAGRHDIRAYDTAKRLEAREERAIPKMPDVTTAKQQIAQAIQQRDYPPFLTDTETDPITNGRMFAALPAAPDAAQTPPADVIATPPPPPPSSTPAAPKSQAELAVLYRQRRAEQERARREANEARWARNRAAMAAAQAAAQQVAATPPPPPPPPAAALASTYQPIKLDAGISPRGPPLSDALAATLTPIALQRQTDWGGPSDTQSRFNVAIPFRTTNSRGQPIPLGPTFARTDAYAQSIDRNRYAVTIANGLAMVAPKAAMWAVPERLYRLAKNGQEPFDASEEQDYYLKADSSFTSPVFPMGRDRDDNIWLQSGDGRTFKARREQLTLGPRYRGNTTAETIGRGHPDLTAAGLSPDMRALLTDFEGSLAQTYGGAWGMQVRGDWTTGAVGGYSRAAMERAGFSEAPWLPLDRLQADQLRGGILTQLSSPSNLATNAARYAGDRAVPSFDERDLERFFRFQMGEMRRFGHDETRGKDVLYRLRVPEGDWGKWAQSQRALFGDVGSDFTPAGLWKEVYHPLLRQLTDQRYLKLRGRSNRLMQGLDRAQAAVHKGLERAGLVQIPQDAMHPVLQRFAAATGLLYDRSFSVPGTRQAPELYGVDPSDLMGSYRGHGHIANRMQQLAERDMRRRDKERAALAEATIKAADARGMFGHVKEGPDDRPVPTNLGLITVPADQQTPLSSRSFASSRALADQSVVSGGWLGENAVKAVRAFEASFMHQNRHEWGLQAQGDWVQGTAVMGNFSHIPVELFDHARLRGGVVTHRHPSIRRRYGPGVPSLTEPDVGFFFRHQLRAIRAFGFDSGRGGLMRYSLDVPHGNWAEWLSNLNARYGTKFRTPKEAYYGMLRREEDGNAYHGGLIQRDYLAHHALLMRQIARMREAGQVVPGDINRSMVDRFAKRWGLTYREEFEPLALAEKLVIHPSAWGVADEFLDRPQAYLGLPRGNTTAEPLDFGASPFDGINPTTLGGMWSSGADYTSYGGLRRAVSGLPGRDFAIKRYLADWQNMHPFHAWAGKGIFDHQTPWEAEARYASNAALLGLGGYIPPVRVLRQGDARYSITPWVGGKYTRDLEPAQWHAAFDAMGPEDLTKLLTYDALIANTHDRHGENFLIDPQRHTLGLIDNSLSFGSQWTGSGHRSVLLSLAGGRALSLAGLEAVRNALPQMDIPDAAQARIHEASFALDRLIDDAHSGRNPTTGDLQGWVYHLTSRAHTTAEPIDVQHGRPWEERFIREHQLAAGWTPASSMEAVRARLQAALPGMRGGNLQYMDPQAMDEVAQALSVMGADFPAVAGRIRSIGEANPWLLEDMERSSGKSGKALAYFSAGGGKAPGEIGFNPRHFEAAAVAKYENYPHYIREAQAWHERQGSPLAYGRAYGIGSSRPGTIAVHEFGHAVHNHLLEQHPSEWVRAMARGFNGQEQVYGPTEYSDASINERFAESFAALYLGNAEQAAHPDVDYVANLLGQAYPNWVDPRTRKAQYGRPYRSNLTAEMIGGSDKFPRVIVGQPVVPAISLPSYGPEAEGYARRLLAELALPFPQALSHLEGVTDGTTRRFGRRTQATLRGSWGPRGNAEGLWLQRRGSPSRPWQALIGLRANAEAASAAAIGDSWSHIGAYARPGLALRTTLATTRADLLPYRVSSGLGGVLIHEMGHHVDHWLHMHPQADVRQAHAALKRILATSQSLGGLTPVSRYAQESASEGFAETFAALLLGNSQHPLTHQLDQLLSQAAPSYARHSPGLAARLLGLRGMSAPVRAAAAPAQIYDEDELPEEMTRFFSGGPRYLRHANLTAETISSGDTQPSLYHRVLGLLSPEQRRTAQLALRDVAQGDLGGIFAKAPPGTGKTTMLAGSALAMLAHEPGALHPETGRELEHVAPSDILMLGMQNQHHREFADKINEMVNQPGLGGLAPLASQIKAQTWHSFAKHLLNSEEATPSDLFAAGLPQMEGYSRALTQMPLYNKEAWDIDTVLTSDSRFGREMRGLPAGGVGQGSPYWTSSQRMIARGLARMGLGVSYKEHGEPRTLEAVDEAVSYAGGPKAPAFSLGKFAEEAEEAHNLEENNPAGFAVARERGRMLVEPFIAGRYPLIAAIRQAQDTGDATGYKAASDQLAAYDKRFYAQLESRSLPPEAMAYLLDAESRNQLVRFAGAETTNHPALGAGARDAFGPEGQRSLMRWAGMFEAGADMLMPNESKYGEQTWLAYQQSLYKGLQHGPLELARAVAHPQELARLHAENMRHDQLLRRFHAMVNGGEAIEPADQRVDISGMALSGSEPKLRRRWWIDEEQMLSARAQHLGTQAIAASRRHLSDSTHSVFAVGAGDPAQMVLGTILGIFNPRKHMQSIVEGFGQRNQMRLSEGFRFKTGFTRNFVEALGNTAQLRTEGIENGPLTAPPGGVPLIGNAHQGPKFLHTVDQVDLYRRMGQLALGHIGGYETAADGTVRARITPERIARALASGELNKESGFGAWVEQVTKGTPDAIAADQVGQRTGLGVLKNTDLDLLEHVLTRDFDPAHPEQSGLGMKPWMLAKGTPKVQRGSVTQTGGIDENVDALPIAPTPDEAKRRLQLRAAPSWLGATRDNFLIDASTNAYGRWRKQDLTQDMLRLVLGSRERGELVVGSNAHPMKAGQIRALIDNKWRLPGDQWSTNEGPPIKGEVVSPPPEQLHAAARTAILHTLAQMKAANEAQPGSYPAKDVLAWLQHGNTTVAGDEQAGLFWDLLGAQGQAQVLHDFGGAGMATATAATSGLAAVMPSGSGEMPVLPEPKPQHSALPAQLPPPPMHTPPAPAAGMSIAAQAAMMGVGMGALEGVAAPHEEAFPVDPGLSPEMKAAAAQAHYLRSRGAAAKFRREWQEEVRQARAGQQAAPQQELAQRHGPLARRIRELARAQGRHYVAPIPRYAHTAPPPPPAAAIPHGPFPPHLSLSGIMDEVLPALYREQMGLNRAAIEGGAPLREAGHYLMVDKQGRVSALADSLLREGTQTDPFGNRRRVQEWISPEVAQARAAAMGKRVVAHVHAHTGLQVGPGGKLVGNDATASLSGADLEQAKHFADAGIAMYALLPGTQNNQETSAYEPYARPQAVAVHIPEQQLAGLNAELAAQGIGPYSNTTWSQMQAKHYSASDDHFGAEPIVTADLLNAQKAMPWTGGGVGHGLNPAMLAAMGSTQFHPDRVPQTYEQLRPDGTSVLHGDLVELHKQEQRANGARTANVSAIGKLGEIFTRGMGLSHTWLGKLFDKADEQTKEGKALRHHLETQAKQQEHHQQRQRDLSSLKLSGTIGGQPAEFSLKGNWGGVLGSGSYYSGSGNYNQYSTAAQRGFAREAFEAQFAAQMLSQVLSGGLAQSDQYRQGMNALTLIGGGTITGQNVGANAQNNALLAQFPEYSRAQLSQAQALISSIEGTPASTQDVSGTLALSSLGGLDIQTLSSAIAQLSSLLTGTNAYGQAQNILAGAAPGGILTAGNIQGLVGGAQAMAPVIVFTDGAQADQALSAILTTALGPAGFQAAQLPALGTAVNTLGTIGLGGGNTNQQLGLLSALTGTPLSTSPQGLVTQLGTMSALGYNTPLAAQFGLQTISGIENVNQLQQKVALNQTNAANYGGQSYDVTQYLLGLASQGVGVQAQAESYAHNLASYQFGLWQANQEYGQIGADHSKDAYFAFERSQAGAAYDPTNSQSNVNLPTVNTFGLQNEEFYAGVENQRQMLVLGRSKLTSDAAFQQQLKYLDKQEQFYEEQLAIQNAERTFNQYWGSQDLDMQAKQLSIAEAQLALAQEAQKTQLAILNLQDQYLPLQAALAQSQLQGSVMSTLGYSAGVGGSTVDPTQFLMNLAQLTPGLTTDQNQALLMALSGGDASQAGMLQQFLSSGMDLSTAINNYQFDKTNKLAGTDNAISNHMAGVGSGAYAGAVQTAGQSDALLAVFGQNGSLQEMGHSIDLVNSKLQGLASAFGGFGGGILPAGGNIASTGLQMLAGPLMWGAVLSGGARLVPSMLGGGANFLSGLFGGSGGGLASLFGGGGTTAEALGGADAVGGAAAGGGLLEGLGGVAAGLGSGALGAVSSPAALILGGATVASYAGAAGNGVNPATFTQHIGNVAGSLKDGITQGDWSGVGTSLQQVLTDVFGKAVIAAFGSVPDAMGKALGQTDWAKAWNSGQLLPALSSSVATFFRDVKWGELLSSSLQWEINSNKAVFEGLAHVAGWMVGVLIDAFGAAWQGGGALLGLIGDGLNAIPNELLPAIGQFKDTLVKNVTDPQWWGNVANGLVQGIQGLLNFQWVGDAINGLQGALTSGFNSIGSIFGGFANGVIDVINSFIDGINDVPGHPSISHIAHVTWGQIPSPPPSVTNSGPPSGNGTSGAPPPRGGNYAVGGYVSRNVYAHGIGAYVGGEENLSLVGELGAELVHLPSGTHVYSKSDTQDMLDAAAQKAASTRQLLTAETISSGPVVQHNHHLSLAITVDGKSAQVSGTDTPLVIASTVEKAMELLQCALEESLPRL